MSKIRGSFPINKSESKILAPVYYVNEIRALDSSLCIPLGFSLILNTTWREGQAGGVEVLGPEAEKERQPLGTERAKCLVSKEGRR